MSIKKANEEFIKKILENKAEAILAKKYYEKLKKLLKEKKIISIEEVSMDLDLDEMDVRTIFEELILYKVVSGKIEGNKLILD